MRHQATAKGGGWISSRKGFTTCSTSENRHSLHIFRPPTMFLKLLKASRSTVSFTARTQPSRGWELELSAKSFQRNVSAWGPFKDTKLLGGSDRPGARAFRQLFEPLLAFSMRFLMFSSI